jgi:hypothetical protein
MGLMEVSPVFRGMNPATQLEAVKSYEDREQDQLRNLITGIEDRQQDLLDLSEKHADVALKALADSLQDALDQFESKQETEVKAGEQQDNPTPNDSNESEEAKARIRQLQAEKPIHLLGGNDEQQAESPEGEASSG